MRKFLKKIHCTDTQFSACSLYDFSDNEKYGMEYINTNQYDYDIGSGDRNGKISASKVSEPKMHRHDERIELRFFFVRSPFV